MFKYVLYFHPQLNVPLQQFHDEIPCQLILNILKLNVFVDDFSQVLCPTNFKGDLACQQLVRQNSNCPDVHRLRILIVLDELGREVEWSPTLGVPEPMVAIIDRPPEIS